MTFAELMQAIGAFGAVVGAAVSARWGHKQVLHKLESYVTVKEYREGKAALHAENNKLTVRVAILEDRQSRK